MKSYKKYLQVLEDWVEENCPEANFKDIYEKLENDTKQH